MKQIIALLFVLFLVAGCGSNNTDTSNTNGGSSTSTNDGTSNSNSETCGDGVCDVKEMCDTDSLRVACEDDCGACPTSLFTKGFDCGPTNCKETSDNTFEIIGTAELSIEIYNLGGVLANTLQIDGFKCYEGVNKAMSSVLLANYKGYILQQKGFGTQADNEVRLKARGSEGDSAVYKFGIQDDPKREEKEVPFELRCDFEIKTHSPMVGKEQSIYLKVIQ